MHSSYPLSLALLLSPLALAGSSVTCWFPDGQTSTVDHVACDDSAGNNLENGAACCQNGTNDYCLGNGLCSRYGTVYRGSCTDKTWRSPACSQMCLDEPKTKASSAFLSPCNEEGTYQCFDTTRNCSVNTTIGTNSDWHVIARDWQQPGAVNPITYSQQGLKFGLLNDTASTANCSNTTDSTPVAKQVSATAVGAGVGIPLGILLLAAVAVIMFQQKKLRQARAMGQASTAHPATYQQYPNETKYNPTGELPAAHFAAELRDDRPSEIEGREMIAEKPTGQMR